MYRMVKVGTVPKFLLSFKKGKQVFSEVLKTVVTLVQQFYREFLENIIVENYFCQNILTYEFLRMLSNHITTLPSAFV